MFRERYSGELPQQLESNLQIIRGKQADIQALNESIDRDRDRRLALEKQIADALNGTVDAPTAEVQGGDRRSISSTRRRPTCGRWSCV